MAFIWCLRYVLIEVSEWVRAESSLEDANATNFVMGRFGHDLILIFIKYDNGVI